MLRQPLCLLFLNSAEQENVVNIDGKIIKTVVIINDVKFKMKKTKWAIINVEDLYNEFDVIAFSKIIDLSESILEQNNVVVIEGKVQFRNNDKAEIIADKIRQLMGVLWIRIETEEIYEELSREIIDVIDGYQGNDKCMIYISDTKKTIELNYSIKINDFMINNFSEIVGKDNVKVTYR